MQADNQTISDFVRRTDVLADQTGLKMSEIHALMGISRPMVFAYRSGKSPITAKVWLKLARAERAAARPGVPPSGKSGAAAGIAQSSADPKQSAVSESAHAVREDPAIYSVRSARAALAELPLAERVARLERMLDDLARVLGTWRPEEFPENPPPTPNTD